MVRNLMLTAVQVVFAGIISMILFPPEKALPLATVALTWFLAGYFTRGFWPVKATDDTSPPRG